MPKAMNEINLLLPDEPTPQVYYLDCLPQIHFIHYWAWNLLLWKKLSLEWTKPY